MPISNLHKWLHVTYHDFLLTSSPVEDSRCAALRWVLYGAHQSVGNQIEKPKVVDFAQVDVGRVFEDEAADVFLAYEIDVTVLLFRRAVPGDVL